MADTPPPNPWPPVVHRVAAPDAVLAEIAEQQFGVFTRQQALESGLTRHQITRRLVGGTWTVIHPKV